MNAEERRQRYEAARLERVAAAEAHRRELNDAAVAKLAGEHRGAAEIVCPQCHTRGQVTTRQERVKRGISGGKATGAILTGGWSLLATGLARKETVTAARCGHCQTAWRF